MIEGTEARTQSARAFGGARRIRDAATADIAVYSIALGAIYLIQGSLWFFTFKQKLLENGTNPPPGVDQQFDGSIVDRTIGIHAAWIVLGILELAVFAAVAISLAAGEFLPARPKPWLLGALAGGMFTLAVLLFGAISTSDSTTSAQLYAYFGGTAVQMVFVLLLPPYRSLPLLVKDHWPSRS